MPSESPHPLVPQLPYSDVAAALIWLERAFAFQEAPGARFADAQRLIHAELVTPLGGRVMLGGAGGHGVFPPGAQGRPSTLLCVYVDDVNAHCARARGAGARVCAEPEDKFFGDRVYECIDLEGHRWSFHQRLDR